MGSRRLVHDLRAPLVIALGYLDELRLFKLQLLRQLSSEDFEQPLEVRAVDMANEIEEEIGLCVDMIKASLDELDAKIISLRK